MINIIVSESNRIIHHTNFNRYEKAVYHPDRILNEHVIFYILEGNWGIGQKEEKYFAEKGDVVILHAGCHHYGTEKCLPRTRTMYLHMNCFPEDGIIDETIELEVQKRKNALELPVVVRCGNSVTVPSIFQDIINTFWSDLPQKHIKLSALLDLLLFELGTVDKNISANYDNLINGVLSYFKKSPEKIYAFNELSDIFHVSSRTLTKRFKAITGKTIHQYQIDLKLEMGYMAIKYEKERPFKELATNLGFYDEFHFSKLFKNKYGFAPSRLKK